MNSHVSLYRSRSQNSGLALGVLQGSACALLIGLALQPAWSSACPLTQRELGTQGEIGTQDTGRFLVRLEYDQGSQADYWLDLAAARQAGAFDEVAQRAEFERDAQALRYAEVEQRIEALGGRVEARLQLLPSLIVTGLTSEQLEELPQVARVERDRLFAPASLNVALNAQHHDTKGANQLLDLQGLTIEGTGQVIGLIDTGIDTKMGALARPHLAFFRDANPAQQIPGGIWGSRILSAVSSVDPTFTYEDLHGHGTRMASIALGFKYNNNPGVSSGAAPDALVRSYRVDNDFLQGIASFLDMNKAIDAASQAGDVRVVLLAWDGTRNPIDGCNPDIDAAALAGITTVMSAGNDGSGAFYHGSYNGLPVGASYLNTVEPYAGQYFTSAIGPMIDGRIYPKLIAVGENLTSAVPDQETTSVGSYGSSGAAAITAGTAALVLQAVPSLTNRQLRALLIDTASDVTLGDSFAAGYGYLRSKRAVQAAQAGAASEGQIQGLVSYHWPVTLTQGEVFKSTLVWQQKPYLASDDLELVLRGPNGLVVAESRGSQDTVEQVRIVADQTGTYELTLEAVSYSNASNGLTYAITGVPATPASVTPNLCGALPQPTLLSLQQGKLTLPLWSGQQGAQPDTLFTVLKGCKLNQVTGARIGLVPVPFQVWSEKAVSINIPKTTPQGINIVTLDTPIGQVLGVIGIANTPLLTAPYTVGSADGGLLSLKYKPNSAFAYLVSLSQSPTLLPGFLDLAIGAAGTDLTIMTIGNLNAMGEFQQYVGGLQASALIGSKLYCQAALVDPDFPAIPLLTSNVATSLIIF